MPRFLAPVFGLLACFALSPVFAQVVERAPRVEVVPIKGPLFELRGKGGNVVASIGEDGVLLIDSDYAEYAAAHEAALSALQITPGAPRYLFNTHWHFDHVGGNLFWGEKGTLIAAQENVYQRMSTRQEMKIFDRVVEPAPAAALPVITYSDEMIITFNDDRIRARHFPHGHTDGDSIIFFTAQNVVHMGDHLFRDAFPFVDIGSGGNAISLIENLVAVRDMINDDTVLVPGHGAGFLDKAELTAYIKVLEDTARIVQAALAQGKSVEDITAAGLGDQYASYGQGFISEAAWISFVAGSL
ncbi:MBL fold metallo-hydrolase [Haliea sp. E17]|uniref:MBL fold metallo-hydrolase n=1 Tax=Haliea sp. E17 TaxID=3401576 RepID=UPI003AAEE0CA